MGQTVNFLANVGTFDAQLNLFFAWVSCIAIFVIAVLILVNKPPKFTAKYLKDPKYNRKVAGVAMAVALLILLLAWLNLFFAKRSPTYAAVAGVSNIFS